MTILTVENFSCIRSARLETRPITILIGPQASGKSVLTKLHYFFSNIIPQQYSSAQDGNNIKIFRRDICRMFAEWFPPSAWGNGAFVIEYHAGNLSYKVKRRHTSRRMYDEVEIETSDFFDKQYESVLSAYRSSKSRRKNSDDESLISFDKVWRVQSTSQKSLRETLKRDYILSQIFVPAGRSFFTNLGKAVAMLEYGSQLDSITKRFGRLFTNLLDGGHYYYGDKQIQRNKEFISRQKNSLARIFGGNIRISTNDRHVETGDGRKIPFSVLSSGQQELLPLVLILQHFTRSILEREDSGSTEMIYVEEPEAHLFPEAQGAVIEHIATISNFVKDRGSFFITTHSPYVLAKLNNLIKAFSVSSIDKKSSSLVEEIVSKAAWIAPGAINAYALQNGHLGSIKDVSGLLDGSYLDSISNDISSTFLGLLEVEADAVQ